VVARGGVTGWGAGRMNRVKAENLCHYLESHSMALRQVAQHSGPRRCIEERFDKAQYIAELSIER
jgi:hypothetical protein